MKLIRVIKRPILTEKSLISANDGRYTFEVDIKSNKKEIAVAVKEAFNVDVLAVKTRIIKGKRVRIRGTRAQRPGPRIKKATVVVAKDQKIPAFETG